MSSRGGYGFIMDLYLVSKASSEKTSTGIVQSANMFVFGIFTDSERADAVASKHDASVSSFKADKETSERVLRWLNPGYVS